MAPFVALITVVPVPTAVNTPVVGLIVPTAGLELAKVTGAELKRLGEAGKDRKTGEEEREVGKLRKKHHVS